MGSLDRPFRRRRVWVLHRIQTGDFAEVNHCTALCVAKRLVIAVSKRNISLRPLYNCTDELLRGFDAGARHFSLVRWHVAWLLLHRFYPHPDYGHHIS